jgi:hypothetical protein
MILAVLPLDFVDAVAANAALAFLQSLSQRPDVKHCRRRS